MPPANDQINPDFAPAPHAGPQPPEFHHEAPEPHELKASPAGDSVPVVRVLSARGIEYGMMTICLWLAVVTLGWVALNLINGSRGFNYLVVPTSVLIVTVPVFGLLFLRLKKAELANPALKKDPSKRRWSQTTQFVAFIACLANLIFFIYTALEHLSGNNTPSLVKAAINLVVVLVIAGGILTYYWADEHKGI